MTIFFQINTISDVIKNILGLNKGLLLREAFLKEKKNVLNLISNNNYFPADDRTDTTSQEKPLM